MEKVFLLPPPMECCEGGPGCPLSPQPGAEALSFLWGLWPICMGFINSGYTSPLCFCHPSLPAAAQTQRGWGALTSLCRWMLQPGTSLRATLRLKQMLASTCLISLPGSKYST